jgi:phage terminase small subunit
MAKTGRRSFVASDVTVYGDTPRLAPPASLGEGERKAFLGLVMSCPAGQFAPADLPLLCAWAENVAIRERMATRLALEGEITDQGKVNPAFNVHREAVKTLNALALRLRVSPQSRMQKAPKRETQQGSYYDRMNLELQAEQEREGDDAAPEN